jgi:hypothetical protein
MPRRVCSGHAELDDQAVADFLAGDYHLGRRDTTPSWFGAGHSSQSDIAARSEEFLADGFGE